MAEILEGNKLFPSILTREIRMKLRGIEFGNVFCASGARNFFGEGYWFHPLFKLVGMNYLGLTIWSAFLWMLGRRYLGSTFVAKTTTMYYREGNMLLTGRLGTTPKEWKPECIAMHFLKASVVNAVGLSGPGLEVLLHKGRWQTRTKPFLISFMSVEKTAEGRLLEAAGAVHMLQAYKASFHAPFGIEINFSCPNVKLEDRSKKMQELVEEIKQTLEKFDVLGIPLLIKLNVLTPPEVAKQIADIPQCDAITCSNTLPWGTQLSLDSVREDLVVSWEDFWGSKESPLKNLIPGEPDPNRGGLSGKYLFPLVREWLKQVKKTGITKPLVMGGGILSWKNARTLLEEGASAVFLGTIGNTRPWRVPGIIWRVNRWFR